MRIRFTNSIRYILFAILASLPLPVAAQSIQTPATPPVGGAIVIQPGGEFHSGDDRFHLKMETDGNVNLRFGTNILWSSNTGPKYHGQWPQKWITVACQLQFQSDGNLVIMGITCTDNGLPTRAITTYNQWQPLWSSGTYGNNLAIIDVQNDGNVIIKKSNGQVLWTTNTCCY